MKKNKNENKPLCQIEAEIMLLPVSKWLRKNSKYYRQKPRNDMAWAWLCVINYCKDMGMYGLFTEKEKNKLSAIKMVLTFIKRLAQQ